MAVLALIYGFVTFFTAGRGIYPEGSEADILKGNIGPIPKPLAAFLLTVAIGQFFSSSRALAATFTWWAATFAPRSRGNRVLADHHRRLYRGRALHGVSAVLMPPGTLPATWSMASATTTRESVPCWSAAPRSAAARIGAAHISGAFIIALVEGLLLVNGFSTQMQYLTIGVTCAA